MNFTTRLFSSAMLFLTCFGMAFGGEAVTVQGKIETIDLADRRIVISPRGKDEKIELELTRKTTIKRDGKEDVGLDTIKVGEHAKIKYDSELLVVAIIELGEPERTGSTEAVNLEELNGTGLETNCFATLDGLELFWGATPDAANNKEFYIYTARRANPEAFFKNKQRLFNGTLPVLSSDALQLYYLNTESGAINLSTRKSRDDEFGRPRPIPSLATFAAPYWLSEDGKSLYLTTKRREDTKQFGSNKVTRESAALDWGKPSVVSPAFDGQPKDFSFGVAYATTDDLNLLCNGTFTDESGKRVTRLGILSRTKPSGSFTRWQEIPLKGPDGEYPWIQSPRFVPKTNELFLCSNALFPNSKLSATRGLDLWVIKDFHIPIANISKD